MAIVGKGAKSIKKKDLANQKSIGVGFKQLRFWHKAAAGETGINLLALVFPTELAPSGRQNPSKFELSSANIKFFKNNLTIRSSLRGVLMDGLAYDVPGATRINWLNFTTAVDEIFEVTLDENAKTGRNIVDGRQIICSGVIPAGETDINLGTAIEINVNPNFNVGSVTLHIDRGLQLRNTNNSSVVKDKDYIEVDPGGGLGIILRLNTPDLTKDREFVIMSVGIVAEKPNESQLQEIEKVQGQIDAMVPTLASLAGVLQSTFQSSGPNNIDLKAFGACVTQSKTDILANAASIAAIEAERADPLADIEFGNGTKVAITSSTWGSGMASVTLTPGIWKLDGDLRFIRTAGSSLMLQTLAHWSIEDGDDTGGTPDTLSTGVSNGDLVILGSPDNLFIAHVIAHDINMNESNVTTRAITRYIEVTNTVSIFLTGFMIHSGTWNVSSNIYATKIHG